MKKLLRLSLISTMVLFTACGGGSSNSSNSDKDGNTQNESQEGGYANEGNENNRSSETTNNDTNSTSIQTAFSKISGTVPGTLIEAFCEDGTYVQVTSTQNGTDKHPFEIIVPKNISCKLVMTTNQNDSINRIITTIGFSNGTDVGTAVTLTNDLNLSHIPLALSYADINDTNGDHVLDNKLVVTIDSKSTLLADKNISDSDNNGIIDAYDDSDNNEIVNAYEDDDQDGVANLYDDEDNNTKPDYLDDDNNDGIINHNDDRDNNGKADYIQDDDGDGKVNHIDSDDDGNGILDELENSGKETTITELNNNSTSNDSNGTSTKDPNNNESSDNNSVNDSNNNESSDNNNGDNEEDN